MLKVAAQPPEFTHPVTAFVPIDDGHREETFKVRYRVMPSDRVKEYDLATEQGTTDFLRAIVARLEDVGNDAGEPIRYSDEVRDQVFKLPYARAAILNGYTDAVSKASLGNFSGPRGNGRLAA